MLDKNPEVSIDHDTATILIALADEVKALAKNGSFTYDDYIELQIKHLKGRDTVFVRSLVRQYFDYEGDAAKPDTWQRTNSIVKEVGEININFVCLLTDPLIIARSEPFLKFARKNPLLSPEELRKTFIETFPVKTYYRGYVMTGNNNLYPNSHLAPNIRTLVKDPEKVIGTFTDYTLHLRDKYGYQDQDGSREYLYNLPILRKASELAWRHVTNRETESDFLSVSELPEVSWYILCDHKKKLWKDWTKDTFFRLFKFQMNSFYAPTARELAFATYPDAGETSALIKIEDDQGTLQIRQLDALFEQLIPVSLPVDFDKVYVDYRPEFVPDDYRPVSFRYARATDFPDLHKEIGQN